MLGVYGINGIKSTLVRIYRYLETGVTGSVVCSALQSK